MDPMTALDASAARVLELVGQADRSQWGKPTPCPEWNVRELIGHLLAGMLGYTRLLHGAPAADLREMLLQQATLGGDYFAPPHRPPSADAGPQERLLALVGR